MPSKIEPISEDELRQMYWDDEMSTYEIAKVVGVCGVTILKWMKNYGIELRTNSESQIGCNIDIPNKEDLHRMYWDEYMSIPKIAKLVGVSFITIRTWMKNYGIELRTVSEAMLVLDNEGPNSPNWRGGISGGEYCYKFNNLFKEAVRERDDYTCQLCRYEQKLNGRLLDVHHVHYDKDNCYPDVVALCHSCNMHVNSNRDYWEAYFESMLIERGLYCWSINNIVA